MSAIYINNKTEAEIAARIATNETGVTFDADDFLNRYISNVLNQPYIHNQRETMDAIGIEIHVHRTQRDANYQGLHRNSYSETDQRIEGIKDQRERGYRKRDAVIEAASRMGADYWYAQRVADEMDLDAYTVRGAALQIHAEWVRDEAAS